MPEPFVAVPSYLNADRASTAVIVTAPLPLPLPPSLPVPASRAAPIPADRAGGRSQARHARTRGPGRAPARSVAGANDPGRVGVAVAAGPDLAGPDLAGPDLAGPGLAGPDLAGHGLLDLSGLGPLAPYAAGDQVTDLCVNGGSGLWLDAGRGLVRASGWECPEEAVRDLAVRLIALGGRHIDEASPCVDVRLADGIRVHAVLPPASSTGTLLSIRLPRAERPSLAALGTAGLCGTGEPAGALVERLRAAVRARENLLITGAAGSGKTTLLAALLGEVPLGERIVAIEDVAELRVDHPHFVALESRQANLEGAGRIGLDSLLREALRMRPDRLVLGECRGAEIRELLAALNTGHDGGAGTLHANSLRDVPARLEALGAVAGMTAEAVARQTVSAIGLVLHLERRGGERRLAEIGRFVLDAAGRLCVTPVGVLAAPARAGANVGGGVSVGVPVAGRGTAAEVVEARGGGAIAGRKAVE